MRDNGGPAFPRATHMDAGHDRQNRHEITGDVGMSLRDYFIAHAPVEPQSWFRPEMPPGPTRPREFGVPTANERRELDGLWDYLDEDSVEEPRVIEYAKAVRVFDKANHAWSLDSARERYVQWPSAWADSQLKARNR